MGASSSSSRRQQQQQPSQSTRPIVVSQPQPNHQPQHHHAHPMNTHYPQPQQPHFQPANSFVMQRSGPGHQVGTGPAQSQLPQRPPPYGPPQNPQYYLMFGGTPIQMSGQRPPGPPGSQPNVFLAGMGGFPRQGPPPPQVQQTITIRNDVNLKKHSLRVVQDENTTLQHLQFTVDAAKDFSVSIFFLAAETAVPGEFRSKVSVPMFSAQKGLSIPISQPVSSALDLRSLGEEMFRDSPVEHPIVIVLQSASASASGSAPNVASTPSAQQPNATSQTPGQPQPALNPATNSTQCQITYAMLVQDPRGETISARVTKQKIVVQGRSYELQEIYGMDEQDSNEDTHAQSGANNDVVNATPGSPQPAAASNDDDEDASMCVICMSEKRDTAVLPCRHMCLCSDCAKVLRLQTNKCPICRATIESLLHIKINREASIGSSSSASGSAASPS